MGHKIKCLHCKAATTIEYQTLKSSSRSAWIQLDNAPMYYCPKCNDRMISLEAIEAFHYIKSLPLNKEELNIFDYNAIIEKL